MHAHSIPTPERKGGFTLVEVMFVGAIALLLTAGAMTAFLMQRRTLKAQQVINEMQQNARSAMEMVVRDLRMTGYGLPVSDSQLSSWITWVPNFTTNPRVVQGGGSTPDTLTVAAAFEAPVGTLAAPVTNQTQTLVLNSGGGALLNTGSKRLVYVGKNELARIVSKSGDTITISTSPTLAQPLRYSYPAGAPVELVRVITYAWANPTDVYPYTIHLRRIDSAEDYIATWQQLTAGFIEDFQLTPDDDSLVVSITARASVPDGKYVHPTRGDHYRRMSLTQRVFPRNSGI